MKRTLWISLLALCAMLLVVACAPVTTDTSLDAPMDDGHAGSATSSFAIEGTGWLLTQYAQDGALVDVPADVAITADFGSDQTFSLYACNTMHAPYVADGEMLTIAPGPMTMMACEGALGEIEGVLVAAFPNVLNHNVTDGVLTMSDADGNPPLCMGVGCSGRGGRGQQSGWNGVDSDRLFG